MKIGVPSEVKNHEYRVGLTPEAVHECTRFDHQVLVQSGAGAGIGITDQDYQNAGARMVSDADEIFADSEMIVKVKEPQPVECRKLKEGQTLFTYLHLAPDPEQAALLQESGCTAIAYETVTDEQGGLPLLAPMSEVAGRLSVQAGGWCVQKHTGGSGVLLGGVPGVAPAKITIIGGGVSGYNAARMAVGSGAEVTIFERSIRRIRYLDDMFQGRAKILYSTQASLFEAVVNSDIVIGAVLIPGAQAPRLINRAMLKAMRDSSAFVDIAIDQGGCSETSRPTTHDDPTYIEEGITHYCVANMPGAVARTSTFALGNATLPFVLALANKGAMRAVMDDPHLKNGLNVHRGKLTHQAIADALDKDYVSAEEALAS